MSEQKKIKSDLISRGEFFHGGDPESVASEWADCFTASDAASWMDAGFWTASVADTLRDLGYTPQQIVDIRDAQVDRGIEYNSGDLIYALCNYDASSDDLSR